MNGSTYTVAQVRQNNCFDSDSRIADLAILVFSSDVTSVSTFPDVYKAAADESEVGHEFTLMGWGGFGVVGGTAPSVSDGTYGMFHRGYNVFTDVKNEMLVYKMDKESAGGLELEAIAYDGDSGGPAFIEVNGALQIAGINSFGDCDPPEKCPYGSKDYYIRLGGDVAYNWIQSNMVDNGTIGVANSDCSDWPEDDSASYLSLMALVVIITNI